MRPAAFALALALVAAPSAARAEDDAYELVRGQVPAARAGQQATLSLSILPRAGHRLLKTGPVLVQLTGENLRTPVPLLEQKDAVDPQAEAPRWEIPITPSKAGPAALDAKVTFWICRAARCRPVVTSTRFALDVTP